ncbi:hypothetical protein YC2023_020500 [Brassica napus]
MNLEPHIISQLENDVGERRDGEQEKIGSHSGESGERASESRSESPPKTVSTTSAQPTPASRSSLTTSLFVLKVRRCSYHSPRPLYAPGRLDE